jgi:hypothetical protein
MSNPLDFVTEQRERGVSDEDILALVADALKTPICPFCGERLATLLCDQVIGFEWKGETMPEGRKVISLDSDMFTCDRPICASCATNTGTIHYSGKVSGFDSRDLCPTCHKAQYDDGMQCVTRSEADAIRNQRNFAVLR